MAESSVYRQIQQASIAEVLATWQGHRQHARHRQTALNSSAATANEWAAFIRCPECVGAVLGEAW
jgi:hypothetical protein